MTGNEFVERLGTSLTRFRDQAAEFVQSHGTDPAAGSIAATERSNYSRVESLHSVAAVATVLMESVSEHLTAFVKTITEPVEPIACWTCVRSMLESASIAAWLFEPGIDVKTRVGRSFAHRYEGMEQELKLMRAIGRPAREITKLEDHINDTENIAASLGFQRLRDKNNKRMGIGERMPSATDMIKTMLNEDRAYRLLSAVAHGHFWAIQQLGSAKGETVFVDGVATTAIRKHSGTVEGYGLLAMCAAKSFALPLWNQCVYYSWDKARLTAILESVYDEFQAKPEVRFWR